MSPFGQTASAVKQGGRLIAVQVPGARRCDATKHATSSPFGEMSQRVTWTPASIHWPGSILSLRRFHFSMRTERDGPRRKITATAALRAMIASTRAAGGSWSSATGMAIGRPGRRSRVQPIPYGLPHTRLSTVGPPGPYSAPTQPFQPIASIASKMIGIVQLALVRRQARRRTGELHVPDQRQMRFHALEHVTLHHLHVVEVVHDLQVRLADLGDHVGDVLDARDEIVRPVALVERLQHQEDVFRGGRVGGALQVRDQHGLGRGALVRRHDAGEDVERVAADRHDVVERLAEGDPELRFAPRHGGKARLALAARAAC